MLVISNKVIVLIWGSKEERETKKRRLKEFLDKLDKEDVGNRERKTSNKG